MHIAYILLEPSLRSEGLDVFAVDFFVAVDDPGVGADYCATGDVFAADFEAFCWYDSGET